MTWHGQINRTIWEIQGLIQKHPKDNKLRAELLRTHFLQRFEYDRSLRVSRDDRTFLFMQENRGPAILLIHGAHGTPAEMRELGNFLFGKGFTVYCPRLSRYDLKNRPASWESWVTMAENALTTMLQYTPRTSVAGLSLGGTIALILDTLHPIERLILLAPALHTRMGIKARFYASMRHLTPTLFYRVAGWNGEVAKAMDHARKVVKEIKTPTLVLQARDDHVVSNRGLNTVSKRMANSVSEIVLLPSGSHAITRGKAKEEVFARIHSFTQKTEDKPAQSPAPK
jgi:carboxylesterase